MSVYSNVNPNFPVEGISQSSSGFRDNFSAIKKEIENLQSKTIQLTGALVSDPVQIGSGNGNLEIATSYDINIYSLPIRTITSSPSTLRDDDYVVLVKLTVPGPCSITMPVSPSGKSFVIKDGVGNAATNNITIIPSVGTIDGKTVANITSSWSSITCVCDGTNWNII